MRVLISYTAFLIFLLAGVSYCEIIAVEADRTRQKVGEKVLITVSFTPGFLSESSDLRGIKIRDGVSGVEVYPINVSPSQSVQPLDQIEMEVILPKSVPIGENQSWEVIAEKTVAENQVSHIHAYFDFRAMAGDPSELPLQVRRSLPTQDVLIDRSENQRFQIRFTENVGDHKDWKVFISSNGINKTRLTNINLINPYTVEATLSANDINSDRPTFYISSDQLKEAVLPNYLALSESQTPLLKDIRVDSKMSLLGQYGSDYEFTYTFENANFQEGDQIEITYNHPNIIQVNNVTVGGPDNLVVNVSPKNIPNLGPIYFEIKTSQWERKFQNTLSFVASPVLKELSVNNHDRAFTLGQHNTIGVKLSGVELDQLQNSDLDIRLHDRQGNFTSSTQTHILQNDSVVFEFNNNQILRSGMMSATVQSSTGRFPSISVKDAFIAEDSRQEPYLDHIMISPTGRTAQLVFSQEIKAKSIQPSSQVSVVFENDSGQEKLKISLAPLIDKADAQVFTMSLSETKINSMLSKYTEYGNLGRIEYEANIFESKTDGKSNFSMENSYDNWVYYDLDDTMIPFKIEGHRDHFIDFNNDSLYIYFETPSLAGVNQEAAVPLFIVVKQNDKKDTLQIDDIRSADVIADYLRVDVSDIAPHLRALLDHQSSVELILPEGVVYDDDNNTNIAITTSLLRDYSYFGHKYNSIKINNGSLWVEHAHLDLKHNHMEIYFSVPIDTHYSTGQNFQIQVESDYEPTKQFDIEVGDGQWDFQYESQSMAGTLHSETFDEIKASLTHGSKVSFLIPIEFARSSQDPANAISKADSYDGHIYSDLVYVQSAHLEDGNSRLVLGFTDMVHLDVMQTAPLVLIEARQEGMVSKKIELIPGDQAFVQFGYHVEVQLDAETKDSIQAYLTQGYADFRVTFSPSSFQTQQNDPVEELTYDHHFRIYPSPEGQDEGRDFHIVGTIYNLVENKLSLLTNSILRKDYQPQSPITLTVWDPQTQDDFDLTFDTTIEYDDEENSVATLVVPEDEARQLEQTYGFLEGLEIIYSSNLLQNQANEQISNNFNEGGIPLNTQRTGESLVKKVQFNTDTYHLQIFLNQGILPSESPFLTGGTLSGLPATIILSVSNSAYDDVVLFGNPDFTLITSMPDISDVDGDRELIFDLSSKKAQIDTWKSQGQMDKLFVYADSGAFTFEQTNHLGESHEIQNEILANVTLTDSKNQAAVESINFDTLSQTLLIEFTGELAPDYNDDQIALVSFDGNDEPIIQFMPDLFIEGIKTSNRLTFDIGQSPTELLGIEEEGKIYVYVGPSAFVSERIPDEKTFLGWNTANLTEILVTNPDDLKSPLVEIDFDAETTQQVIGTDLVYSRFADFRDSASGRGKVVQLVPGFDLYFKYANTSDNITHLHVPSRPFIARNETVWSGIQVVHMDSNLQWRRSGADPWETGDHKFALLEDQSQSYQFMQPASASRFRSIVQTKEFMENAPVWKPSILQYGTALQIDFVSGSQLKNISNATYKLTINGPQGSVSHEGNQSVYEQLRLDTGYYSAAYELYSKTGDLMKEHQIEFHVSNQLEYQPSFENEDHSNWYMLGVGDNSKSVLEPFNEGAGAFRWVDDAPIDDLYGKYVKIGQENSLEPGEGFWVYNADTSGWIFSSLDDDISEVRVETYYGEDGWQQISNPWSFPIHLSAVQVEGQSPNIWEWDPEVSDFVLARQKMDPGKGYFVRVEENDDILILQDPWFPSDNRLLESPPFAKLLKTEAESGEWSMNLKLRSGQRVDDFNLMGILHDDFNNQPDLPSSMGENIHLNFADGLLTDFKLSGQDTYFWDINLSSTVSGLFEAQLEVSGLEAAISQGYQLYYFKSNKWHRLEPQNPIKITKNEEKVVIQATKLPQPSLIQISNNINLVLSEVIVTNTLEFEVKKGDSPSGYSWAVIDSHGREVYSKHGERSLSIAVSVDEINLQESGVYFLKILASQGQVQGRFTFLR